MNINYVILQYYINHTFVYAAIGQSPTFLPGVYSGRGKVEVQFVLYFFSLIARLKK